MVSSDKTLSDRPAKLHDLIDAGDMDEEEEEDSEPVKILQATSTFGEVTIWGHDMLPAADDPFAKGVEEWIAFAEAIHMQPEEVKKRSNGTAGEAPAA